MFTDLKSRLYGTFHTVYTPFLMDYSIDYESLSTYLHGLYHRGARIFYAMAYNSRYGLLSDSEILALNEFTITTLKRIDPNNLVVVGDPIMGSTQNSVHFAEAAKSSGADMISLLLQEKFFTESQVLDHLAEVGRQTGMPIMVHEMPFFSGYTGEQIDWPVNLFDGLKSIPQVVALKEDSKKPELTKAALSLEPDIRIVIAGTKANLLQFLPYGARAYLNGISSIDAEIGSVFWEAAQAGEDRLVSRIIKEVEDPFFKGVVAKYGWHRCNKAILQAAGIMHRRDRMPMQHLSETEFSEVATVYQEIIESWSRILEERA